MAQGDDVPAAMGALSQMISQRYNGQDVSFLQFHVLDQWLPGQIAGQAKHICWAIAAFTRTMETPGPGNNYGMTVLQQTCVHDWASRPAKEGELFPIEYYCSKCELPMRVFDLVKREG